MSSVFDSMQNFKAVGLQIIVVYHTALEEMCDAVCRNIAN